MAGVSGFFLSSTAGYIGIPIPLLRGASFTMGASASILGLLGAMAHYGRKGGSSLIRGEVTQLIMWFAIMGLLFPGTDNYAHAGGFLGGYAVSAVLNPFTRERGDHMLIAAVCLVATVLSIVVSLMHGSALLQ